MARYIDADKKLKALENMNLWELDEQEKFGVRYTKLILSNAPTADVQEVKHGHWQHGKVFTTCSVCGENRDNNDECWNYCPYRLN